MENVAILRRVSVVSARERVLHLTPYPCSYGRHHRMKRAVLALLVAVAASPAPTAHAEAGGPVSTSDYAPVGQPLIDFSDTVRGTARLSLRVERGLFTVSDNGHLRTFKRKYLYTLTNTAFSDGLWLDQLAPSTCGAAYLA